jgi:hypothetical protein
MLENNIKKKWSSLWSISKNGINTHLNHWLAEYNENGEKLIATNNIIESFNKKVKVDW